MYVGVGLILTPVLQGWIVGWLLVQKLTFLVVKIHGMFRIWNPCLRVQKMDGLTLWNKFTILWISGMTVWVFLGVFCFFPFKITILSNPKTNFYFKVVCGNTKDIPYFIFFWAAYLIHISYIHMSYEFSYYCSILLRLKSAFLQIKG